MGKDSSIEWTDHTFNPWHGCQKVSEGCRNCYAATLSRRWGDRIWGPPQTTPRKLMRDGYWQQPLTWNRVAEAQGVRRRVFCASMADVFEDHPMVTASRDRLWELIEETQYLDWLLLTKRPENILRMIPRSWHNCPPNNVWYGTSVENQEQADRRIPLLLQVPARLRFLSCEPLVGPVDLRPWLTEGRGVHWVIVGGESGQGARAMDLEWAVDILSDCKSTGTACFIKQLGSKPIYNMGYVKVRDHKGGNIAEWPKTLQVRQFPGHRYDVVGRDITDLPGLWDESDTVV